MCQHRLLSTIPRGGHQGSQEVQRSQVTGPRSHSWEVAWLERESLWVWNVLSAGSAQTAAHSPALPVQRRGTLHLIALAEGVGRQEVEICNLAGLGICEQVQVQYLMV